MRRSILLNRVVGNVFNQWLSNQWEPYHLSIWDFIFHFFVITCSSLTSKLSLPRDIKKQQMNAIRPWQNTHLIIMECLEVAARIQRRKGTLIKNYFQSPLKNFQLNTRDWRIVGISKISQQNGLCGLSFFLCKNWRLSYVVIGAKLTRHRKSSIYTSNQISIKFETEKRLPQELVA